MISVSIHQKINLRSYLSKRSDFASLNKSICKLNTTSELERRWHRKIIGVAVTMVTGRPVTFLLRTPYTKYFKSFRSSLNDGDDRNCLRNDKNV